MTYRPDFIDNAKDNTLAKAINAHLAELESRKTAVDQLSIATAYFRPQGLAMLHESLKKLKHMRLLIGAEPLPAGSESEMLPGEGTDFEAFRRERAREAAEELLSRLKRDRDKLPFSKKARQDIERFVEFLNSKVIETRQVRDRFLHAKVYLFEGKDGGAIAGSSNLTPSGLRGSDELNLGVYEGPLPDKVHDWFKRQWEAAEPIDLAAIYQLLLDYQDPYHIFIKVLFELYSADVLEEDFASSVPVTDFQRHGVWRALKIMEELNGAIIADSVGLGKTYTAGAIISQYNQRRQRVLIVCPAAVRDTTWKKFLSNHQLLAEVVSYEELAREHLLEVPPESQTSQGFGGAGSSFFAFDQPGFVSDRKDKRPSKLTQHPDEYSLVVVDEAHNYRNPYTPTRAAVLRNLLWGRPKDILMLSATPVNNSLWDFFNLLRFFVRQDAQFADRGILSLQDKFQEAMAKDVNSLSPDELYPIIDATTVKRTRLFIKKYYPNSTIWVKGEDGVKKQVPIVFPDPVTKCVRYSFERQLGDFFTELEKCLAPEVGDPLLKFARYQHESYRTLREDGVGAVPMGALIGLLRSGLLKRLESSAYAFHRTISRMVKEHQIFLQQLKAGKVVPSDALREISSIEDELDRTDDVEKAIADIIKRGGCEDAKEYNGDLEKDVRADLKELEKLQKMVAKAAEAQTDDKLEKLIDEIAAIAKEAADEEGTMKAPLKDRRKVLVFSYFADTAEWIHRRLAKAVAEDDRLAAYRETQADLKKLNRGLRLSWVSGGNDSELSSEKAAAGFAPESSELGAHDIYDIMVSTDVLAEGVNLQQARHIINYDLPWNPMRLVQRHGRIDRIGSKHPKVFLRSYFPDKRLDTMLKLQERISKKIAMAAAAVGVTSPIVGEEGGERDFAGDIKVIMDLEGGDPTIFENGGTAESSQTAEQYRQELRKAMKEVISENSLKDMPAKAGSITAKGKWPGYFFLAKVRAKVGGKPMQRLYLRFIHTDAKFQPVKVSHEDGTETYRMEQREATCLRLIECKPEQQREADTNAEEGVYAAWDIAAEDILAAWTLETDPNNLLPKIRPTNRNAATFVRANLQGAARTITREQEEEADRIMLSPWPRREEVLLRTWVAGEEPEFKGLSKLQHAELIVRKVLSIGLKPSTPAPTLPQISKENLELVCWMALKPGKA